jgi:hypothetical protein
LRAHALSFFIMTTRQTFRSAHGEIALGFTSPRLATTKLLAAVLHASIQCSSFGSSEAFTLVRDSVDICIEPDYCPEITTIDAGGEKNVPM